MADTNKLLKEELPFPIGASAQANDRSHYTGIIKSNRGISAGVVQNGTLIGEQNVHHYSGVAVADSRPAILTWLCPQDMLLTMTSRAPGQRHGRVQPDAGSGFLESQAFLDWYDMKENRKNLWVHGKAGAGKTFLVSRVKNKLKPIPDTPATREYGIAFLYMHRDRPYSCEQLLGCILRQFIENKDRISSKIQEEWEVYSTSGTAIEATSLVQLIKNEASNRKLYLVIDGWDEYDPGQSSRLLPRLIEFDGCLALLMTSRFIGDFAIRFRGFNPVQITANVQEIRNYVDFCIGTNSRLKNFCRHDPDIKDEIIDSIVQKSQGMFLLVRLHMESLEADDVCTLQDVQEKLSSFSDSLTDKYQDVMNRISDQNEKRQEIAKNTLAWITYAQRPLTINELQHALAVNLKSGRFEKNRRPSPADIAAFCCGMISIENGTVQPIHATAKEFLLGLKKTEKSFINFDTTISQICAIYLCTPELVQGANITRETPSAVDISSMLPESYDERATYMVQDETESRGQTKRTSKSKTPGFPLVNYAAQYLGHHLQAMVDVKCAAANVALSKTISVLTERPKRQFLEGILRHMNIYPPRALSKRMFRAWYGEPDTEHDVDISFWPSDSGESEPLLKAQSSKSRPHGEITSLHLAAQLGVPLIAKRLLSDPSLINVKDSDGCTPLSIALAAGHIDMALVFLKAGATVDLFSTEGCHTLLIAAQSHSSATSAIHYILKTALHLSGQGGNAISKLLSWIWYLVTTKTLYYSTKLVNKCQKLWERSIGRRSDELIDAESIRRGIHTRGPSQTLFASNPVLTKRPNYIVNLPIGNNVISHLISQNSAYIPRRPPRTVSQRILSTLEYEKRSYLKLIAAAFQNDAATIAKLIRKGEVVVDESVKLHDGYWSLVNLALFLAVERKEIDGVKILVEKGVNVDSRDYGSRTPLHRAAERGNIKLAEFLLQSEATVEAKDNNGDTPWVLAAMQKHEKMAQLLIKYKANVQSIGKNGEHKLYSAAANGDTSRVKFFLDCRVNPSITTANFRAPLHIAAANGHRECVRLLVKSGAELSPVSDTGETPLDMAINNERVDIGEFLRSKGAKRGTEVQFHDEACVQEG